MINAAIRIPAVTVRFHSVKVQGVITHSGPRPSDDPPEPFVFVVKLYRALSPIHADEFVELRSSILQQFREMLNKGPPYLPK